MVVVLLKRSITRVEVASANGGVTLVGFFKATFLTSRVKLRVLLLGGCVWIAVQVRFLGRVD